jgi:LacI family transcriptional regulator
VDGAIIYPTFENLKWLSEYGRPSRPLVFVNKEVGPSPGIGVVRTKIVEGAYRAVTYLIEKGHREIGMIAGEVAPMHAINRVIGYRQALEEHGIPFCQDRVILGLPVIQHGFEGIKVLIEREPKVTAVFCYNDLIAIGAVQGCKSQGLRVPDDCALIGFDNIRFTEMIDPPLTTVHVDKYELGVQSTTLLLDMLEDPEEVYPIIYVDTELVVRGSA